jgi:hypothetical protein
MRLTKMFPIIALLLVVFLTGCNKEEEFTGVRPKVTSTDPISEAVSISPGSSITVIFSSDMNPSTMTNANFIVMKGTEVVPGTVTYSDSTAVFTPTTDLSASTLYKVKISTGAKDNSGISLLQDYAWSFTTGLADIAKPTVTLVNPLTSATGVNANNVVTVTFNEPMTPSTINSNTLTLLNGTTPVTGTVVYSGTTATFTPTVGLNANTNYTATVTTEAKDLAGNPLAANLVWTFKTGAVPSVSTINPANLEIAVPLNIVVTANFNVPMNQSTITSASFTLKHGTTAVTGVVTYSGSTASFTPSGNLLTGTTYTATITTGVKSATGFEIADNYDWSFTTGVSTALSVVNLGAAGNYVLLAKTAITNISTSAITGDLGLSPAATSYITGLSLTNATGYATSAQVTGQIFAADMAAPTGINLTTAVENMITAYNDAAGRPTADHLELGTGNIGGMTLSAGLYKWTTNVTLPSDVTLNGGANDVWIFQISQNLLMSNGVRLNLTGGAQAKNIFWQVAGQATFGTTSHFEGIILSMTGITFQTGASFKGRALAQTAIVLDGNAVVLP